MDRRDLEEMVERALVLMVVKALDAAMATTSARAAMISARAAMTSARAVAQRKALMDFLASRRRAARACVQARTCKKTTFQTSEAPPSPPLYKGPGRFEWSLGCPVS